MAMIFGLLGLQFGRLGAARAKAHATHNATGSGGPASNAWFFFLF